jgi:hypothetical protein
MPRRSAKERDFAVNALRVVEQAIHEHLDGTPLKDQNTVKKPAAVIAGKEGGKRGGPARAIKLTPDQRKSIAVKAAQARWSKAVKAKD